MKIKLGDYNTLRIVKSVDLPAMSLKVQEWVTT